MTVTGLFNDSFPPVLDGVTLTVLNYAHRLTQLQQRVTVVTPACPRATYDAPYDVVRYFSLPILWRKPYRYGYPKLDPLIRRRLRQIPFALVHAHAPFSSGRMARYAADAHGVPLVATFHSKYAVDLRQGLPGFIYRQQMRRIRDFYNAADAVWIPQAAVEDTVREYGITAPVTVVPNGNDLADDADEATVAERRARARRAMGLEEDVRMLLFVGQHIPQKGVDIIIDALALLPADMRWQMHFAGCGMYAAQMRRRVESLGLAGRVTFHGMVSSRQALAQLYSAATLFLFPSAYDNAPLVVREAAACGTPSLLPEGSTAAEHICHGDNGFLAPATAAEYAAAITAIGDDEARRVGLAARRTLAPSWSRVIDTEVIPRYEALLGHPLR